MTCWWCWSFGVAYSRPRPVTRGDAEGNVPLEKFGPPIEKCIGNNLKVSNIVWKIWTLFRKLFALPGGVNVTPTWCGVNPEKLTVVVAENCDVFWVVRLLSLRHSREKKTSVKINDWKNSRHYFLLRTPIYSVTM